jgi:hypothetical protein
MVSGVTIIRADKGQDGDYAIALELSLGCAVRQRAPRMNAPSPPATRRAISCGCSGTAITSFPTIGPPSENLLLVAAYGKERSMQTIAKSVGLAVLTVHGTIEEAMPDPVPEPPARPPGEPIIIKDPYRPPEAPEIDGSQDEEEDDPEIKSPPIIPEMPPLPGPWEQADWHR